MSNGIRSVFFAGLALALVGTAYADAQTYEQEFMQEVYAFAKLNRMNIDRLHRDVHVDCYIPITIATIIRSDGTVKDISIVRSSSVPVVDRYFRYVIENAAPFHALDAHFDPVPEEITVTKEFRLYVESWGYSMDTTRACHELKPGDSLPES